MAVGLSAAVVLSLTGAALFVPLTAGAQTIVDGDLIRASGTFDVYIVKDLGAKKFRRLILNPDIFNSYGHLEWGNVKVVDQTVVDQYTDSQLVRNVTGTKVYQLVPNGEDTGDKHWLNMTAAEFVADGYDWDAIYNINAFEEDLYVSGADIGPGGGAPVTSGPVSVTLSPNTAGSATLPSAANNLPFGTWRFTGTGTISSLTFSRMGVGAPAAFDEVYLYSNGVRLTSSRVVNTSTNQVTFGSLNLPVSGSRDVSLVANVDTGGAAGDVNYFQLTQASHTMLVGGTSASGNYPVAANAMTFGNASAGTVTIAETGSVASPFVGAQNVEVSRFTLAGTTEDSRIMRIRLINSGTMNTNELTNVYAQIDSTTVSLFAQGGSNDYVDLVFSGAGYLLEKGKTKTVRVFANIGGERDETIILYVEEEPDVYAVGQTYGFGMQVTNNFSTSSDGHTLTLEGGDVTVAFNGPNATDIGTDTDDTQFLNLAVSATSNIDVRKTQMWICWDDTGNGTYTTITAAVLAELEDLKIVDADTNVLLNGPVDGSSWTIAAANNTVCGDSVKPASYTYTEDWEIDAGQTRNISFRGDVSSDDDLVAGDILKAVIEGWGDLATANGDLTVMRYRDNNKAVKSTEIVPASDIAGNAMTINAAVLTVALASSPVDDTYIKGTQNVDFVGFVFTAGDASDMTLTDLTLDAWFDSTGGDLTNASGSYTNGDTGGISAANAVTSLRLVDKDTGVVVAGPQGYTTTSDQDDDVIFNNLSWLVPAGQSKTLLVRGNISTTATNDGDNDAVFFNINANTDVTALDKDGNSTNAAAFADDDGPNGDAQVAALISSAGSLSVTLGNDTPNAEIIVMGTGKGVGAFDNVGEGFYASEFQADATNEAYNIEKVTLEDDGGSGLDNVLEMAFDYQDVNGNWFRAKGSPDATNGEVTLNLNPAWYIPKDDSRAAKAYVSVGERSDGADSTDSIKIVLSDDDTNDDQFKAVGAASGSTLDDDDISAVTTTNTHRVFNTKPTFTRVSGVGADLTPASGVEVGRFTIAADAHHAVLFTSASGSLEFDVSASGDGTSQTITLYKSDGTVLSSASITDATSTFAFNFEESNLTVPAGGSVTLYVETDLSSYNETNDFFGIRLNGDEADNVKWLDEDNASFDVTRLGPADLIDNLPMNFGTATKD